MKYLAIVLVCSLVGLAMTRPQYGRDPGTAPVGNVEYVGPGQLGGNSGGRDPGTAPVGNTLEYVGPGQLGGSSGGRDPGRHPSGNVGFGGHNHAVHPVGRPDPNFQGFGVGNPHVYGRPGSL